ncbi:MAG: CoA transferase [Acidimicrobiia bacterium]|nr:CoA transferase [Acidimicrobiia bacterium]
MNAPLLDGITVLDLASVGPAARASRWLADYGAEVIKVGPVPRHGGVQITPPAYSYSAHRGMQRVLFDLKAETGRDAFLRLAATADVVIESFRPGVVSRLGIDYDAVREVNPGIVYCSTTGFGQTGPHSQWAGHDLNYLAVGGYLHCSGRDPHDGPALPGATVADSAAGGLHAVASICAALVSRGATGEGAYLDVAIADGVLSLMSLYIDEYFATGTEPGPRHNLLTGRYAWYDVYRTADDGWVAVAAIEPHFFANLCRALSCEQWIEHQYDDDAVEPMRADFTDTFATRDRDDWVAELGPGDCCVSAVLTVPELVADSHYVARGAFAEVQHPTEGAFRQVNAVLAGQGQAADMVVRDQAETTTDAVLAEAGFGRDEIDRLRSEGVVA